MEPLDHHLMLDVLSRLDIQSLFRARLVCKEWLELVQSPWFSARNLVVLLHLGNSLQLWDPLATTVAWPVEGLSRISTSLWASSAGLVCGMKWPYIFVGNPITRKWKKLSLGQFNLHVSNMEFRHDPFTGVYTIGLTLKGGGNTYTYTYDSSKESKGWSGPFAKPNASKTCIDLRRENHRSNSWVLTGELFVGKCVCGDKFIVATEWRDIDSLKFCGLRIWELDDCMRPMQVSNLGFGSDLQDSKLSVYPLRMELVDDVIVFYVTAPHRQAAGGVIVTYYPVRRQWEWLKGAWCPDSYRDSFVFKPSFSSKP
ncbi:hypothetical protein SELMODRAFT_405119 [Selaginella moellendorffii]|uniref:F-box domain-containing protein n=1 Tax=Selaginella moellendorffii TaxID=88036 RepID=D8QYG3_SELML|nr:hypothetical protein SELMODRAFT_405119 [Selaginella moellendorffii]